MKALYTEEQFKKTKTYDLLPCKCYKCDNVFNSTKHQIKKALNPNNKAVQNKYCSVLCRMSSSDTRKEVICDYCNSSFKKQLKQINKSEHNFCSRSCNAKYGNSHKKFGSNRAKLEIYLEEKLTILYSNIDIKYNDTSALKYELDIFIPKLKLAFELNGIFHYEPIFGIEKLEATQLRDIKKIELCKNNNIELHTIDTRSQKYFKESSSNLFLDYIISIINTKLRC